MKQRQFVHDTLRMFSAYSVLCLITLFVTLETTEGKILEGQLITDKNWAFLARFCFLTERGRFRYDLVIGGDPEIKNSLKMLLYYDSPSQWPSVYPSNRTCEDKESILSTDNGQKVYLSPYRPYGNVSGCSIVNEPGIYEHCKSYREFRSARPRWWFIALSDCSSKTGLNVTYRLSLTNGPSGRFWRHHFSADEFYILPELIAAASVYVILLGFSIYIAVQLRSRRLLHVSYKIFVASLLCQLIGLACEIYSQTMNALVGVAVTGMSLTGGLFQAYSETLYTVLLLLLALGYTVTKSQLTIRQIWWLFLFIATSLILQMALFLHQSVVFDPGLVLYIYESPPGITLIGLKILAWLIFIVCCYRTNRVVTSKTRFYATLMSLGSVWFLCHPITVLTVTIFVDKWIRESVAKGFSLWIVFVGHATFLYVTRPTHTNPLFPFHIRTCQVVPAETEQNHSYEPRTRTNAAVFTVAHSVAR